MKGAIGFAFLFAVIAAGGPKIFSQPAGLVDDRDMQLLRRYGSDRATEPIVGSDGGAGNATGVGSGSGSGSAGAVSSDEAEDDQGTRVFLLGGAALNINDLKNVTSAGLAIRGPELWFRFFVSTATDATVSADPGDRAFGRAVLNPETGGRGANFMARWLPIGVQARPSTRVGMIGDLIAQDTTWKTSELSGDGFTGGFNLGITIMAESNLEKPNENNGVLAYADLLFMMRGVSSDLHRDLRQQALNTPDTHFFGIGLRVAGKVDQLLFTATASWFPRDHGVEGLSGAQLILSIALDAGIVLRWAPPRAKPVKPEQSKSKEPTPVEGRTAPGKIN